jgi:sulfite reductase (NADPH) hemoprotein beta-component
MTTKTDNEQKLSANEGIKTRSNLLRGTIKEGLADPLTGAFSEDDAQLTKFHGFYQQDDRDIRIERREQKLEPLYTCMLRARLPGGVATPEQWLAIDKIATDLTEYGTLRLTTRQTFQYHGVLKGNIKKVIQGINDVLIDSIAACGDVNRNVLCNTNPVESAAHQEVWECARNVSEHLLPATRAYYELWLDEEPVAGNKVEEEKVYGKTYLPRKFKIAFAVPPHNDVDVYANDLGFIAILEDGQLVGFNVTAGGGMGTTHGDKTTYPRLGSEFGYIPKDKLLDVATAIVTVQRDWGNRVDRKHARLKYTIDTHGLDNYIAEVEKRAGIKFESPRPVVFTQQGDRYGWVQGSDDKWHLTLFIENGRIIDDETRRIMTGIREIAKIHQGDFRMTSNQNLIIANVPEDQKTVIENLARQYDLYGRNISLVRENSMACVALPTCALAMAESERYLPSLVTKIEALSEKYGLEKQPIVVRMTGCPNGCARPFMAEIGFIGKGPGKYNLYLGADGYGTRMNKMYRENIGEDEILAELDPLFARYAAEREPEETFGNFVVRAGVIDAVIEGRFFHD